MAVNDWIDDIAALWDLDFRGRTLKSYRVAGKREFPETIKIPGVITYTVGVKPLYSQSVSLNIWTGVSEFHLFPNVHKKNIPSIIPVFELIIKAAAAAAQLGGKVSHFELGNEANAEGIQGPLGLQYGDVEAVHLGLNVYWQVKENVSSTISSLVTS
jgi:hypothetical protein